MFNQSKYTKWYNDIVSRAATREKPMVVEKHHIIPGSLGGTSSKNNLAHLTPREHLICHMLLVRMLDDSEQRRKMMWALHLMLFSENPHQQRYRVSSRTYEKFREQFYTSMRGVPVLRTAEHQERINAANTKRLKGKKLPPEWRAKMSASRTGERNGMHGRKHSPESIEKMRINRKATADRKKAEAELHSRR